MPITERQRSAEHRYKIDGGHIWCSDVAAILGLGRWGTAYDVWLKYISELEPAKDNTALEAGRYFEDGILVHAEKHLGPLRRNPERMDKQSRLAGHLDAILRKQPTVDVEVKYLFRNGPSADEWGESSTEDIPEEYIIQVQSQMACVEGDLAYVDAHLGYRGFNIYEIPRNEEFIKIIRERVDEFFENHIVKGIPPPGVLPSLDLAKRVRRVPNKTVLVEPGLVQSWLDARRAVTEATKQKKKSEAAIHAALGDAEAGDAGEAGMVTYYLAEKKGWTVQPSVGRTLRPQKRKGEENNE